MDSEAVLGQDVGIDHCCPDVLMSEEFLHSTDIIALFQEVGSERMAERVAASRLRDSRPEDSGFDGPLEEAFIDVVSLE